MNKLKAYVGLDNRFVMCEKFPDDEEHGGLHELLDEWLGYDDVIQDAPLEQGFYLLEFEFEQDILFNPLKDMSDAYLVVKNITKLKKGVILSEVTEEELKGEK